MNGVAFTLIQPTVSNEPTATADNAVTYSFTTAEGLFFRPTQVQLKASRIGTNGGAVDISWKNANGTYELETSLLPERNNDYTSFSRHIDDIPSATGTSSLVVNIYKLSNEKQIALADITVTGQVLALTSGISTVAQGFLQRTYYSLDGIRLSSLRPGPCIEVSVLPDGTCQSRKLILK